MPTTTKKTREDIRAAEAYEYKHISDALDDLATKHGFGTFRWALRRYDRLITMRRQTDKKIKALRAELSQLEGKS